MDTTPPPDVERLIHERLGENYDALRAELDHADDQLARGDYTEYDETNLHDLAEDIKTRGMARLAEMKTVHVTRDANRDYRPGSGRVKPNPERK